MERRLRYKAMILVPKPWILKEGGIHTKQTKVVEVIKSTVRI